MVVVLEQLKTSTFGSVVVPDKLEASTVGTVGIFEQLELETLTPGIVVVLEKFETGSNDFT